MSDIPALVARLASRAEFEDRGGCVDRQLEDVSALLRVTIVALERLEKERDAAETRVVRLEAAIQHEIDMSGRLDRHTRLAAALAKGEQK